MPVGTTQGLITRCPDCATAFRASAEQLWAREGQVRCGRCGRVFNAIENAVAAAQSTPPIDGDTAEAAPGTARSTGDGWQPDRSAPPEDSASLIAGTTAPNADRPDSTDDIAARPSTEDWPSEGDTAFMTPVPDSVVHPEVPAETLAEGAVVTGQDETDHPDAAVDRPRHEERDAEHAWPALPDEEGISLASEADGSSAAQPEAIVEPVAAASTSMTGSDAYVEDAPASLPPDAVRAEAPSRPDEPHVQETKETAATATVEPLEWEFGRPKRPAGLVSRWVGVPGVLVLLGVLLGQVGYHLRGDLVLLFPSVRPAAEQACEWAGCDLPSPQRAELMSIESSELQADSTNPTVMVLSATLRNRAPFPQAPPALELTLTDLQDQPLARRVLSANDYSVRGVQNNLFPASSELPIKVYFEASAVKATGYRLYLFYP